MNFFDHMKRIKLEDEKNKKEFVKGGNIFYSWEKEQILRFVGDFLCERSHWIGYSEYNPIKLFPDSAFEGEGKLPMTVNCANWDNVKEERIDGGCLICKLREIAIDILAAATKGDPIEDQFKSVKYKCDFKKRYFWNVIDRGNPFIADGIMGYKIATVGQELFDEILSIAKQIQPIDLTGADSGIDLNITKSGGGKLGPVKYKAQIILDGASIKKTPLTVEEMAMQLLDLRMINGKRIDQNRLFETIDETYKDLLTHYKYTPPIVSAPAEPKESTAPAEDGEDPF